MYKNKMKKGAFMANADTAHKRHRQKCEVYSRVVGYLRPVQQWNAGKQAEFNDRQEFAIK